MHGPFVLLLAPLDRDPDIRVSTTGGLMGAAHDTGDGCFCQQRHLPRPAGCSQRADSVIF
jgi:hypothetical protein